MTLRCLPESFFAPLRAVWLALLCLCMFAAPARAATESATDYVVGQFKDHDMVFLSESHLIKGNLDFLADLIPKLQAAGIHHLGWEFASSADQPLIDRLLRGETYDKALAYTIILGWGQPGWLFAYEEYERVYRVAWQLNRSLPPGAQPFRIVALDLSGDRPGVEITPGIGLRRMASWVDINIHWAQVIQRTFIDPGVKAVVYCGAGHTTTRFYNWRKADNGGLDFGGSPRIITAGNIVYHNIGARASRVLLHGGEGGDAGDPVSVYKNIEKVAMPVFARQGAFGVDLAGSPLGQVPVPRKGYVDGKSTGFTLSDLADGYVFLGPMSQWTPVTPLADFITPQNRWQAQAMLRGPGYKLGGPEQSIEELNARLSNAAKRCCQ